jgi:hypothetical protein
MSNTAGVAKSQKLGSERRDGKTEYQ